jgi:hypothetical protein
MVQVIRQSRLGLGAHRAHQQGFALWNRMEWLVCGQLHEATTPPQDTF